jgi:hypothetical protein
VPVDELTEANERYRSENIKLQSSLLFAFAVCAVGGVGLGAR